MFDYKYHPCCCRTVSVHGQEFDYDVTILAFNIRVQLLTPDYLLAKGYGLVPIVRIF